MKKNNLLSFFLLLAINVVFAQQIPREILNGQIVGDSLAGIPNVNVTNISTKKYVISDNQGYFTIYAREKDTLVFSNMAFESKKIVLTKANFNVHVMRVKLQSFINPLDEVVISPYALTGNLETDDKNIKVITLEPVDVKLALTTRFEDDTESSPANTLMPGYVDTKYMTDFMALGKMLFGTISDSKPVSKEIVFVPKKIFAEAVRERFPESFFVNTLQLQPDEIGLFLNYCENTPNIRVLLDPKKEFTLIDVLIQKSKEYRLAKKD